MPASRIPKYIKVANSIRKDIALGRYPVGSYLPPEQMLESQYQVSRATVRSAVQMLVNEGMLKVRQGQGTKVVHNLGLQRFANVTSLSESLSYIEDRSEHRITVTGHIDEVPITDRSDAEFLRVRLHEDVIRYQRILKQDDQPYCILTNFLPKRLVPDLRSHQEKIVDLYAFLKDTYGIQYTRSEETVSAQCASLIESEILNIPINTPLLYLRRLAYCNFGPLECSYQQIRTDIYKLRIYMSNE